MKPVDKNSPIDGPPACLDVSGLGKQLALNAEPLRILAEVTTARAAVERLRDGGFLREAVCALAQVLPIRRAVWWAILSAWHGVDGNPASSQDRAFAAALRWVLEPSESHRGAAHEAASETALDNAPGCCACAAALAGAVSGDHFVPKELDAAATMIAQAVAFARRQREQAGLSVSFAEFLDVGLELLDGQPLNLDVPKSTV